MQKYISYTLAFVVLVILQIFLVDNISLGLYFHPLIYVAFIIMLPLDMKHIWVMLLSALTGLTIDMLTGMGGLNVIAATAVGFMRPMLLNTAVGHNTATDDTMPALHRLQAKNLIWYIILMVVVHSLIYFFMEAMSLSNLQHTALRMLISDVVAVAIVWYVVKLFAEKIIIK
jgi:hypothetical protein